MVGAYLMWPASRMEGTRNGTFKRFGSLAAAVDRRVVCLGTLAYAITSAIAGGSPVQEPGAAIGGSPTSVGVDWWIVAESQRNERGTYAVLDSPAATPTRELTNWNRIAVTTLVAFPPAASGAPPALQVNMGMVQGAVYDAVNAIEPRHRPYLLETQRSGHRLTDGTG